MTANAGHKGIRVETSGSAMRLVLDRPGRGNALTPDLLQAIETALSNRPDDTRVIVLTGAGRAFSAGGDVSEFYKRTGDTEALLTYSDEIVSALNRVILALKRLPCPVLAALNGPVTGGAIGLVLAADVIIASRSAFIQPYYAFMGFAPDGGWTALMPDRIGRARTMAWIARDSRVEADSFQTMGLADAVHDPEDFDAAIDCECERLSKLDASAIACTRSLLTHEDLAQKLDLERQAFLEQIARPDTQACMARFLTPKTETSQSEKIA